MLRTSTILCTSLVVTCVAPDCQAQEFHIATASGNLLTVQAGALGAIARTRTLTGLTGGERIVGLDQRPANGAFYGLTDASRLYRIDPATGAATAVGTGLTPVVNGTTFGFDFNPTVDRIRVVSDADQNLRVHPDTGVVAAVDGTLAYAAGDPFAAVNPNVFACAYTNNFSGATSTSLYGIDSNLDTLVLQNPPNAGVLNTVGRLGVNVTEVGGFDIDAGGGAYAVLSTPLSAAPALFAIDLTTGAARLLAVLGTTERVVGLAVGSQPGIVYYGTASPGCMGPAAIGADGLPSLGNANFALTVTNAHPLTVGRLALATAPLATPLPVLGFDLWVDPFSPGTIWLEITTDGGGNARTPVPIPSSPPLAGLRLHDQYVFADRCTRAGFAASNALTLTLQ